jgi:hypothetical protein
MIKGIRRELDARRQSKATESSIKAHKDTMLGLLRASVGRYSDSSEVAQRRRVAAGDPTATATGSDGRKIKTNNPTPRDSGGHVNAPASRNGY